MKTRALHLAAAFTLLAALSFSAPIRASAAGPTPDPARFARGAKAWADHCGRCHHLRDPKDLPDFEWDVVVTHMRIRANLPGRTAEDIKAFLKGSN